MILTVIINNNACNICYMVDILRKELGYKLLVIKSGLGSFLYGIRCSFLSRVALFRDAA